jgi:hypothetical protein
MKPLGRPRHQWEDFIKMDLQGVGWGYGFDWSGPLQGQVIDSCEFSNEPLWGISWLAEKHVSFSRMTPLHGVSWSKVFLWCGQDFIMRSFILLSCSITGVEVWNGQGKNHTCGKYGVYTVTTHLALQLVRMS